MILTTFSGICELKMFMIINIYLFANHQHLFTGNLSDEFKQDFELKLK